MEKQQPAAAGSARGIGVFDIVSVVLVYLFPLVSGFVFFRVLQMGGAPFWFFFLQGLIFFGSLGQAVYFLIIGLWRALRRRQDREER